MNKRIYKLLSFAAAMLFPALMPAVLASHFMGGDLTYACVAPGTYVINTKIYRDCTGATAPTSITLDIKPQGCSGGRSITVAKTGNPIMGMPYCSSVGNTCSTSGLPNYEAVNFSTTITFTNAELACAGGIMVSCTNNSRPEIANLVNSQGNIYAEAYINTAPGINNNSPAFSPLNIAIPFICVGSETTLGINAAEQDGDSLVYSLKEPLSAAGTPYMYKSYPTEIIYNSDSSKYVATPAGTFSAAYPIPSFKVDWSKPMPIATPVPSFVIDPVNGTLKFTPTHYTPNSPPVNGTNKFALVVQIDEYRKVNGIMKKVGHIRRDMLAIMVYCGRNISPTITNSKANGALLSDTSVIYLTPSVPLTLQFNSTDPNPADILNVSSNVASVLTGSTVTYSTGNRPTGTINWTPTAADVRVKPYYFSVNVSDGACPIQGVNIQTYTLRVRNTGSVTGTSEEKITTGFVAYPNPFRNEVSFKLNLKTEAQTIVIYNALGQKVDQLNITNLPAGNQSVKWTNASKFAAGSYVAKLISADKSIQTVKFSKLQ